MTATEKRKMKFESVGDGCRLGVYVDGVFKSRHEPWVDDKEAAKDYMFKSFGFEYSPIEDVEVSTEDMKDETKIRKFKYYGPHNLEDLTKLCTLKDGVVHIDKKAFEKKSNLCGLKDYMTKHYAKDINKLMKERNLEPIIVSSTSNQPKSSDKLTADSENKSGVVNHTAQHANFGTGMNQPNPVTAAQNVHIPDNAGFDANNRFMVQAEDGTFRPNFRALVKDGEDRIQEEIVNADGGVDIVPVSGDEYRQYLKNIIQYTVSECIKGRSDSFKTFMTNDKVVDIMNRLYESILSGSIEEINHRLTNEEELYTFIMKNIGEMFASIVNVPGVDATAVQELFDNAVQGDMKNSNTIHQPEEVEILDDTPVDNTSIEAKYPFLKDIEKLITYPGTHGVKFVKDEYGLIKAAVFAVNGTDDEAIEAKSFTMDMDGLIFNKDLKFWPGIENTERPDFKKCYLLTTESIVRFRDGVDLGEPLFGASLPKLNRYVDIRTLFSLIDDSTDMDLAQKVLVETKKQMMPNDRINKRFSKNRGVYSKVTKTNETTFEFAIVFNDEYPRYVGGESIKNTGGTGNLVVKVSSSEDNKTTVTK